MTFRFHTVDDHLVGVSDSDITDESLANRCRSIPDGTAFQGALEIIPFAYGDGGSFLYHPSTNGVQIHCRILEITGR